jgi:hypothetical protein
MRSVTGFLIVFLSATTALADPRIIVYNTFNPDGKTVVHVAFIVDEIRQAVYSCSGTLNTVSLTSQANCVKAVSTKGRIESGSAAIITVGSAAVSPLYAKAEQPGGVTNPAIWSVSNLFVTFCGALKSTPPYDEWSCTTTSLPQ